MGDDTPLSVSWMRSRECDRDDGQVRRRFVLVSLALLALQRSAWEASHGCSFSPTTYYAFLDGMGCSRGDCNILLSYIQRRVALTAPSPTIFAGRTGQSTAWSHHILRWGWIGHILADTLLACLLARWLWLAPSRCRCRVLYVYMNCRRRMSVTKAPGFVRIRIC